MSAKASWLFRDLVLGVLLAAMATMTGMALLHGEWLGRPELILGPIAVAGILTAFALGLMRYRALSSSRRIAVGTIWAIGFTFILVLPPGIELLSINRQRQSIAWIEASGGYVYRDPGGPDWLRKLLGDERMKYFDRATLVSLNRKNPSPEWERLAELRHVTSLYFYGSNIRDDDLQYIAGLSHLQGLDLSRTTISDRGLHHLAKLSRLEWLKLDETWVSDEGLRHLSCLDELAELVLTDTHVRGTGLKDLGAMPGLEGLEISGTPISNDSLRYLSKSASIRTLILHETQISDTGLVHVSRLKGLEVLGLDHTSISDQGLRYVAKLERLKVLALNGTRVSDAGLEHLTKMPDLEVLDVLDTDVTHEGLCRVAASLPKLEAVSIDANSESEGSRLEESLPEVAVFWRYPVAE